MTITTRGRRRTGVAAFLAIPAIVFALTACAPAAGGPDASGGGGDSSKGGSDSSGGGAEKSDFVQWQFDYAACMREQGIDQPDPEVNSGGGISMKMGTDQDMDAMMAAGEKCREELGDPPPLSAEEKAAADKSFVEWATKAAECYRENGYDMPDPKAGEAPEFPSDAPEEVVEECGGGAATTARVQE
jgi:hypothetical protein